MTDTENFRYADFTFYNNTEEQQPAIITQHRDDVLVDKDDVTDYKATVARFSVSANTIPAYIPRIATSDFGPVFQAHVGTPNTVLETFDSTLTTNLNVVIQSSNNSCIPTLLCIRWVPENATSTAPTFINPTRQQVLNTPFYRCYTSLHICKMISSAVNSALTSALGSNAYKMLITANEKGFDVLFNSTLFVGITSGDVEIAFSDSIAKLFPIHYVPHATLPNFYSIAIDPESIAQPVSLGFVPVNYYVQSSVKSSRMLPFNKLIIRSSMAFQPQQTNINTMNTSKTTEKTLTDFSLENISNPDTIYQMLLYNPSSYERWINMTNTPDEINKFSFQFILSTPDGHEFPVQVGPDEYVTLKLLLKQI